MKKKILHALKILLVIAVCAVLIYFIFVEGKSIYGRIIKLGIALAGAILAIINNRIKPSPVIMKKYENAYKDFLAGAFVEDKKSYKKLVEASIYWDRGEFDKAHKILDKLLEKCACTKDYLVVYNLKAISYARAGRNEPLVDIYKKMLQYNMTDSNIWSNLGWIYLKMGKTKESYDALSNAITYDPENPNVYNNFATYFIKTANPESALEYAKKAMELNPNLYQPMSTAAMACMMLGDREGADKYCELYVSMGGDESKLKAILGIL